MDIESLNPEQRTAVTTDAQYVLILAGAGSGKTKVLTTRMAWLIEQGLVSPGGILAVTFTNKAAKEMLTRVGSLLPINTRAMWVGTFHGLCNRLLRAHYRDVGLPQSFQILDMQDQLSSIKRLLKLYNVDTEKFPPKDIQHFINRCKEQGLRPHEVVPRDNEEVRCIELYELYQTQCDKEGVVDFAELLLRSVELLKNNGPVREHYQRRFSHILIDEFQDTNDLQYQWLRLLAGQHNAIFAVGDDDQSIYAFRGANVGNMQSYEHDYARGNIIRLEQNYRSYQHILGAANLLIEHNKDRLGKKLWTAQGEGELVRINELNDDRAEAQWIVDEAKSLMREGVEPEQIAVLYRSNAQSRVIEHAFFSVGLPYRVYGGLRFFERQEIKHVLAYLRLIHNLDDDTSFLRVVNFPARGIGARTLENLGDASRQIGCSLALAIGALKGAPAAKLADFVALIQRLKEMAKVLTLPDLIQQVMHDTGLEAFYQSERDGEDRLDNLQELVNAAQVFCVEYAFSDTPAAQLVTLSDNTGSIEDEVPFQAPPEQVSALSEFLAHASLEAGDNQAKAGEQAIQLMTVHAAKGLEFDVVFVAGMEQGLFPHKNSIVANGGLEEERRLMYVAITRARQRLYLTGAHVRMMYGQTEYTIRSQFLDEIPEEHTKWLSPRVREASSFGGGFATHNRWGAESFSAGSAEFLGESAQKSGYSTSSSSRDARHAATSGGVQVGDKLFKVGQNVSHPKFGEGIIISVLGQGSEAQAQIVFAKAGVKTLALGIAKLDIV
ncbi:UvrD-helicase domain-containing protein [Pelistega europaea]|uniref:DNA 3'-5' helicase n=1 Tax=Pelistega europaea TaxID=106147 RepID=A0A7Y4L9A5_9BURK|nr:UvrD-helicase domain-containing protein [Pelistega europaea]